MRHDGGPASPLRPARAQQSVSTTSRVLAKETQSDDEDQETQETIPLDFDDVADQPMQAIQPSTRSSHISISKPPVISKSETKPLRFTQTTTHNANRDLNPTPRKINLHDKRKVVPLVSPDTETAPMAVDTDIAPETTADGQSGRATTIAKGDVVKDKQSDRAEKVTLTTETPIRKSNRNEQPKIKREPSPAKNQPTSVKREAESVKAEQGVKYETPFSSRVGSRSTTPATGSVDKRKLLPIPGWKGGRSSRALAKRDSFEDDDGPGYQSSLRTSTVKQMRDISTSTLRTGGHEESPLQAKKYTRPAKHGAIPAHMATEMIRSRTTGSPARDSPDRSTRAAGIKNTIHSDPVQHRSEMTPFANRDRNVRRGSDASSSKDIDVKSRRMAGVKVEEKGVDKDGAAE